MAVNISKAEFTKYKFPHFSRIHILIKIRLIRVVFRHLMLWVDPRLQTRSSSVEVSVTDNFEKCLGHFKNHGWAFVEDCFPEDVHNQLIRSSLGLLFQPCKECL